LLGPANFLLAQEIVKHLFAVIVYFLLFFVIGCFDVDDAL
jgi:hypothetical protein